MNQEQQTLFDAVPASGEIEYQALYDSLYSTGKGGSTRHFHAMRRAGLVSVRTERTPDGLKMFVSRPAAS